MSDPLGLKEPMTTGSYTCLIVGLIMGGLIVLGLQAASLWLAS